MKQFSILLILLLAASYGQATIRRCNKNPAIAGVYRTAQAAHDASNPGDTIHLEPGSDYGDLEISKRIVLISTGDFLLQNPGYQAGLIGGSCNQLSIYPGAEGTVISALVNSIEIQASNITITNTHCKANIRYTINVGNILVSKSIITSGLSIESRCTDLVFNNNYIGEIGIGGSIVGPSLSATFTNNIINHAIHFDYMTIYNSIFSNNIFINTTNSDPLGYSFVNCIFLNNFSQYISLLNGFDGQQNSGSGNSNNVDMATVFTNWGNFHGDNYQLLPGYSNVNIGMFAGTDFYKLSTTPAVPSIYQLNVPSSAAGNTMNFTISTKSND